MVNYENSNEDTLNSKATNLNSQAHAPSAAPLLPSPCLLASRFPLQQGIMDVKLFIAAISSVERSLVLQVYDSLQRTYKFASIRLGVL